MEFTNAVGGDPDLSTNTVVRQVLYILYHPLLALNFHVLLENCLDKILFDTGLNPATFRYLLFGLFQKLALME